MNNTCCKQNINKDRERIKDDVEVILIREKKGRRIRTGESRINHIIDHIHFKIDNPNYVRIKDKV